jgi:hypothetical protein
MALDQVEARFELAVPTVYDNELLLWMYNFNTYVNKTSIDVIWTNNTTIRPQLDTGSIIWRLENKNGLLKNITLLEVSKVVQKYSLGDTSLNWVKP